MRSYSRSAGSSTGVRAAANSPCAVGSSAVRLDARSFSIAMRVSCPAMFSLSTVSAAANFFFASSIAYITSSSCPSNSPIDAKVVSISWPSA